MVHFLGKLFIAYFTKCLVLIFLRSTLSHDFYQAMISSESMNLFGWKQLAIWSLEHSCMDADERAKVERVWRTKWLEFCQWIVDTYTPFFEQSNWVQTDHRH